MTLRARTERAGLREEMGVPGVRADSSSTHPAPSGVGSIAITSMPVKSFAPFFFAYGR